MFTNESSAIINNLRNGNAVQPMKLNDYFELLFESCCTMWKQIDAEELYIQPISMFGILSYLLSHKHGYDFTKADEWIKNDFISTLRDPKGFASMYDILTMTPYIGLTRDKEDILLYFLNNADNPADIRVLGKPIWIIYADFLLRTARERDDTFRNAIAYTMGETYKSFLNAVITQ